MASPTVDYLRSPFENVLQILPQGHDKALKQAFYNTAATLFVVIACCAAVAVYYILEAFLRPLLWAVLCGTFLHPFKHTLTHVVKGWMKQLRTSGTPILVGTVLIPFQMFDFTADRVGKVLSQQVKSLLVLSIALPAVYIFYYFGPLHQLFTFSQAVFSLLYGTLEYFTSLWVWTLAVAYVITALFYWNERSIPVLQALAIPVWSVVLLHVISIAGPLRVPLLFCVVVLTAVGFLSEVKDGNGQPDDSETVDPPAWKRWFSRSTPEPTTAAEEPDNPPDTLTAADQSEPPTETDQSEPRTESPVDQSQSSTHPETPKSDQSEPRTHKSEPIRSQKSDTGSSRPSHLDVRERERVEPPKKARSLSDHCFIGLFWAIVLVKLWMNAWLLQLLPILIVFILLKKLGVQLGSWRLLRGKLSSLASAVCQARLDILAPKPIRGLANMVVRGDGKVVSMLEASLDKVMSVLLIVLLIVGTVIGGFFMAMQVHRESVHLVTMASNVVNKSVHPQIGQWVPDNDKMQEAIDSMMGSGYEYGREWIASKVQSVLSGDAASKSHVEEQLLDMWDKMYQAWLTRNNGIPINQNTTETVMIQAPEVPFTMDNLTDIWGLVQKAKSFDLDLVGFVKENIGMVMSVVESIWLVLSSNISLATNVLWGTVSLLLGGGTALLNLVLAVVIFLTTLFYLLASSGEQYLPVEMFTNLTPAQGSGSQASKFGVAVEEAIGSVFLASFKMAAFYGVFTWLTHSAFGVQIVYIPAALASVFAAIPFLGTYWATIPAVIELWLVNGQGPAAIMLFVCHMLPTYIVDTAIYSEIKGGHPYMTGLAIAGGMYWLGLEGAIMGPILLCCLVVAVNVYGTMLRPDVAPTPGLSRTNKPASTRSLPTRRQ